MHVPAIRCAHFTVVDMWLRFCVCVCVCDGCVNICEFTIHNLCSCICVARFQVMNRPEAYHPKLGKTADFEVVLDMSQPLCTPHHFRFFSQTSADPANTAMGTAVKRMLKDTLNM